MVEHGAKKKDKVIKPLSGFETFSISQSVGY